VRAFQVLSTPESSDVSVLDFGGADVSVPVSFGDQGTHFDNENDSYYDLRPWLISDPQGDEWFDRHGPS
jgi:hypothetical protein